MYGGAPGYGYGGGMPPGPQFGGPPPAWGQPPAAPGYGAPGYGAPPPGPGPYGAAGYGGLQQQPAYGQAPGYGAPQQPPAAYGGMPGYGAPPAAGQYGGPAPPPAAAAPWGQPAVPGYGGGMPPPQQQPQYGAPAAPGYGAPPPGPQQQHWGAPPPQQQWGGAPPPPQYPQQGAQPPMPGYHQGMPPAIQAPGYPQQHAAAAGAGGGVGPCQGHKRAVFCGCNYPDSLAPLRGCINDVKAIKRFAARSWGFPEEQMVVLTDDSPTREGMPTRANMVSALRWLVSDAKSGDSLLFHFSGHGGQKRDTDGDEDDGMDETICPCDYQKAGAIVDDELFNILVAPLPPGCRLTAIFDCCHSGSALDLPYMYDFHGRSIGGKVNAKRLSRGDVIMFSGCADNQTSADAVIQGKAAGAMSTSLMHVFATNEGKIAFLEILRQMRTYLQKNGYTQVPQMSSSREMDMKYDWIV